MFEGRVLKLHYIMKKITVTLLVFCGMFVLSTVNTHAQELFFYITNKTGFTCNTIQVTPSETTDWGSDILPGDFFQKDAKVKVTIPEGYGTTCMFDIKITDMQGGSVVYYDIDACKLLNITIFADGSATVENE